MLNTFYSISAQLKYDNFAPEGPQYQDVCLKLPFGAELLSCRMLDWDMLQFTFIVSDEELDKFNKDPAESYLPRWFIVATDRAKLAEASLATFVIRLQAESLCGPDGIFVFKST